MEHHPKDVRKICLSPIQELNHCTVFAGYRNQCGVLAGDRSWLLRTYQLALAVFEVAIFRGAALSLASYPLLGSCVHHRHQM